MKIRAYGPRVLPPINIRGVLGKNRLIIRDNAGQSSSFKMCKHDLNAALPAGKQECI